MFERICNEFIEKDGSKERPVVLSILAIYYMLNPFLYLYSISLKFTFLNFGVNDWRFALLYCVAAPVMGYLLWTLRVRTNVALYAFLTFEVIRGARHGYWDAALLGVAVLLYAARDEVRRLFRPHERGAAHREAHH